MPAPAEITGDTPLIVAAAAGAAASKAPVPAAKMPTPKPSIPVARPQPRHEPQPQGMDDSVPLPADAPAAPDLIEHEAPDAEPASAEAASEPDTMLPGEAEVDVAEAEILEINEEEQSFKFRCSACDSKLGAQFNYQGIAISCPRCQSTITIPYLPS